MDNELDLIFQLESDCSDLAQPIINKLCKRAICSMNKNTPDYFDSEDFPNSFSFIDILSIKIQDYLLIEINPYLENYIQDSLDIEFRKLLPVEQLVVAYCDCTKNMEPNYDGYQPKIYDTFRKMLDEHYYLKKIQHYVDKCY